MKQETYYFEIKDLVAQFCAAFNDIIIRRYNNEREAEDRIHVSFIYSPKQRTLHAIANQAQHIKLPIVSVFPTGFQRDQNRVFNKVEGPWYPSQQNIDGYDNLLQPVPINISIGMSIITRFQHDLDQILSNWIPYCDPYIVISWRMPYSGLEIRSHVIWSGKVSIQDPKDIPATASYRWIADTTFTIEGWLFKKPENPAGKIYKITTDFTSVSTIFDNYELMERFDTPLTTETFITSARPQITLCDPYIYVNSPEAPNAFNIYGDMFDYVTNLYVSGSDGVFEDTTIYNPASSNEKISGMYPMFSGVEISNWNIESMNHISFSLPSAVSAGYVDVIAFNEAGYGKLTSDSIREVTFNPWPSGSSEYNNYIPYQHPCISGIQAINI